MTSPTTHDQALDILRDALAEAQTTVRSYDTKAQIVGVGYVFALGIVGRLGELLPDVGEVGMEVVVVSWAVVILPILLFGYVLHPTRKTAPHVADPRAELNSVLYIDPAKLDSVEAVKVAVAECDPESEYAFELIKVTKLRELKRKRFLRALFAAAVGFLFLFGSQVIRSL